MKKLCIIDKFPNSNIGSMKKDQTGKWIPITNIQWWKPTMTSL